MRILNGLLNVVIGLFIGLCGFALIENFIDSHNQLKSLREGNKKQQEFIAKIYDHRRVFVSHDGRELEEDVAAAQEGDLVLLDSGGFHLRKSLVIKTSIDVLGNSTAITGSELKPAKKLPYAIQVHGKDTSVNVGYLNIIRNDLKK